MNTTALDNEKNSIRILRRCQRSWDLDKTIPQQHIDHWIDLAKNSPSKQDEAYFDLYVLRNRNTIEYLYREHTWGFTYGDTVARNPQARANVLFVFVKKLPPTDRCFTRDHKTQTDPTYPDDRLYENGFVSLGMAAGIVGFSAAGLGYATGFTKNFGYKPDSYQAWASTLGVDTTKLGTVISVCLGIGYPDTSFAQWNQSQETELLRTPSGPMIEYMPTVTYSTNSIKGDKAINVTVLD
jgi:Nitroreductase family